MVQVRLNCFASRICGGSVVSEELAWLRVRHSTPPCEIKESFRTSRPEN